MPFRGLLTIFDTFFLYFFLLYVHERVYYAITIVGSIHPVNLCYLLHAYYVARIMALQLGAYRFPCSRFPLNISTRHSNIYGMDGATKQCKVTNITVYEIEETPFNSTVNFSITLQDPNCSCQICFIPGPWAIFVNECEKEKTVQLRSVKCQQIGGQYGVIKNGTWMLLLDDHKSNCFSTPGREVFLKLMPPTFTKNDLTLEFHGSDIRIKTWNLTIYKFREEDSIPLMANSSILQLKYKFDPKGCYCFKLHAIGEVPLKTFNPFIPFGNCMYIPDKADRLEVNSALNLWQVITLMVLAGLIIMVVLAVVLFIFNKRRRAYSNSNRSAKKNTVLEFPDTCELLLLYAGDCQHHHRVEVLKNCLQPHLKVHDLYKHDDMERLADCNGWLLRELQNSSMRIVLVDSPVMTTLCSSLQTPHSDKSSVEQQAEEQHILLQLKFAVHQIITTSLARDYSRVFVIRFDDASVEKEEEEGLGLIVNCRRYNLPYHHDLLLRDILTNEAVSCKV
ncbi:uncharacterized protein [Panulirus ornatus]|uniref:uncharacterized protein isoform X3 n=1 Tax=Panulirus ornatus TaxID=150431 RepID=UPI003A8B1C10